VLWIRLLRVLLEKLPCAAQSSQYVMTVPFIMIMIALGMSHMIYFAINLVSLHSYYNWRKWGNWRAEGATQSVNAVWGWTDRPTA